MNGVPHFVAALKSIDAARLSIVATTMAIAATVPAFGNPPSIYPPPDSASEDIAVAFKQAGSTHKRIILDFGGDWCTDCHVLDSYFHDGTNKPLLEANYILVHVNIGHRDQNLDLADKFQVPLNRGVPALAVIDENGNLLYSQKSGEFEAMRSMQSSSVTEFLVKWKSPNVIP